MYYNYDRINSYNAFLHFILTNRGYGKSWGAKYRGVNRFVKYGEQFIYIRRYKTELKKIHKFFDDIKDKFPNHTFKVVGMTFYCDGKVCGYAIPLSTSLIEKSTPYPKVMTIIFDEFIIDKGNYRYINDEVDIFLNLLSTIIRKRNGVKVYCLANNVTTVNPYFSYFDIQTRENERFTLFRNGRIIVEISTDDIFIEEMENTDFGQLIKGTKFGDYAINNKSLCDTNTFIESPPKKDLSALFNISYKNEKVQIWVNNKNYKYHVSDKIVNTTVSYSLDSTAHDENSYLHGKSLRIGGLEMIVKQFQFGNISFENQNVKSIMYNIFRKLGVN